MEAIGAAMGRGCRGGEAVFLSGTLGAGKTTFARGAIRALGHRGAVKSPTYTLAEPYALSAFAVHHLDLYRIGAPEELETMGIRDYLGGESLVLLEWPERGAGVLPTPDLAVDIRILNGGENRALHIAAHSRRGVECLRRIQGGMT